MSVKSNVILVIWHNQVI